MLLFHNHIVEKPFYVPSTGKGIRLAFLLNIMMKQLLIMN